MSTHQNNEYFRSHCTTFGNRSLTLAGQNIRKLFNDEENLVERETSPKYSAAHGEYSAQWRQRCKVSGAAWHFRIVWTTEKNKIFISWEKLRKCFPLWFWNITLGKGGLKYQGTLVIIQNHQLLVKAQSLMFRFDEQSLKWRYKNTKTPACCGDTLNYREKNLLALIPQSLRLVSILWHRRSSRS